MIIERIRIYLGEKSMKKYTPEWRAIKQNKICLPNCFSRKCFFPSLCVVPLLMFNQSDFFLRRHPLHQYFLCGRGGEPRLHKDGGIPPVYEGPQAAGHSQKWNSDHQGPTAPGQSQPQDRRLQGHGRLRSCHYGGPDCSRGERRLGSCETN